MANYIYYRNELYHHGIKGQKWGQRNGPPYPLDIEDHSTSEKKANWKRSLNKTNYDKSSKTGFFRKKVLETASNQANDPTYTLKNNINDKWSSLSDKQRKRIKIGAAAVVSALAIYGTYRVLKSKDGSVKFLDIEDHETYSTNPAYGRLRDIERAQLKGRNIFTRFLSEELIEDSLDAADDNSWEGVNGVVTTIQDLDKWPSGENTVDNCIKIINSELSDKLNGRSFSETPLIEQLHILNEVPSGRLQNCMFCSAAYELNRRGYKCQANDRSTGGILFQMADMFRITDKQAIMKYNYSDSLSKKNRAKEIINSYISTYPNGARGNISINWRGLGGGAHSMAWEIIDNQFTIIDAQTGKKYNSFSEITKLLNHTVGDIISIRTDNAEPDEAIGAILEAILPVN
jgi:hypothetical protein